MHLCASVFVLSLFLSQGTAAGKACVPLQALLVEVYEREGDEGGLQEAAQVRRRSHI